MSKELFSFLFVFISLIVGALYYTNAIQSPFIDSLNYLKNTYHQTIHSTEEAIDKYFSQAKNIEILKEKLKKYDENRLITMQLKAELHKLYIQSQSKLSSNPSAELVRITSYEEFANFNRLWIDIDDYNSSKIYGLVYKEIVAGIIISKNNRPLALLNKDIKCTYAVHIGNSKAPGIAIGNNNENIIVKYIPAWLKINTGDEITSSGLDGIFFEGLKVGKIISVSKSHGFQTAIVQPYYHSNNPSYFHMIRNQK